MTEQARGPLGPIDKYATEEAQHRASQQMAACAEKDCRYADLTRRKWQCETDPKPHGCDGYQAHVHLADFGPVLRWSFCARQRAWWKEEQQRLRADRSREQQATREPHSPRRFPED